MFPQVALKTQKGEKTNIHFSQWKLTAPRRLTPLDVPRAGRPGSTSSPLAAPRRLERRANSTKQRAGAGWWLVACRAVSWWLSKEEPKENEPSRRELAFVGERSGLWFVWLKGVSVGGFLWVSFKRNQKEDHTWFCLGGFPNTKHHVVRPKSQ